jgi:shikimate dehydrogenase
LTLDKPALPLSGKTMLIAHVGHPTATFKAPMIYNPYFASIGLDVQVVPMGVTSDDFSTAFPAIMRMSNVHGALVTMPHKVSVLSLLDEVSATAAVAGACNAVIRLPDGRLAGDMFDGVGFVRSVLRAGQPVRGGSALVIGCGGVGSAIAASLADGGVGRLRLSDIDTDARDALARRIRHHHPALAVDVGPADPAGCDIVVNGTPLGMRPGDPMPLDTNLLEPSCFVGEVVMASETTPFLEAARARGCRVQLGIDMLFEMIPAYLDFFGYPTTSAERLRELARIAY